MKNAAKKERDSALCKACAHDHLVNPRTGAIGPCGTCNHCPGFKPIGRRGKKQKIAPPLEALRGDGLDALRVALGELATHAAAVGRISAGIMLSIDKLRAPPASSPPPAFGPLAIDEWSTQTPIKNGGGMIRAHTLGLENFGKLPREVAAAIVKATGTIVPVGDCDDPPKPIPGAFAQAARAVGLPTRTIDPHDPRALWPELSAKIVEKRMRMLATLAKCPEGLPKSAIAVRLAYKRSGGAFIAFMGDALDDAIIQQREDGRIVVSELGRQIIDATPGAEPMPPPGRELRAWWRGHLKPTANRILDVLVAVYPNAIRKEALAERAGASATGGSFIGHLGVLVGYGLADPSSKRGFYRAAPILVDGAA